MPERARVLTNGDSQTVELPKSYQFPEREHEVLVRRAEMKVILEPVEHPEHVNGWPPEFLALIGSWKEEIPLPRQRPITETKDPFE